MTGFKGIRCVSVAVDSIDAVLPAYTEGMNLEVTAEKRASKRGFDMDWVELGKDGETFLELIEPTTAEGPIAKFLAKNGVSHVYQVRFAVDDLDAALADLEGRGMSVLKGKEVPGELNVGWIHPRSTGGVLFELVEYK